MGFINGGYYPQSTVHTRTYTPKEFLGAGTNDIPRISSHILQHHSLTPKGQAHATLRDMASFPHLFSFSLHSTGHGASASTHAHIYA